METIEQWLKNKNFAKKDNGYIMDKCYPYNELPKNIQSQLRDCICFAATFKGNTEIERDVFKSIWLISDLEERNKVIYTDMVPWLIEEDEPKLSPEEVSRVKEFIETGEIKGKGCLGPTIGPCRGAINRIFNQLAAKLAYEAKWSGEVREFLQESAKEFDYQPYENR